MLARQPLDSFNDAIELLKRKEVLRGLVPVLTNLVKIMLKGTAERSCTCTAERSFSGVRLLKSCLRSGMKQQRLKSVAVMNVHMKETKALSIAALILSVESVRKNSFAQPSCDLTSW